MFEKEYDQKLGIRTTGMREWRDVATEFNRYEATPYKALDELFRHYKLRKGDKLVDFGCGRGRVPFYVHHHFHIPVTGIEVNDQTYDEALRNKVSYRRQAEDIPAPIQFEFGYAEQYDIQREDNRFYFFNPFSAKIFKKVVMNILASLKKYDRSVDIILYYPLGSFTQFLKEHTPFYLMNKVRVPKAMDKREQFLIYRYKEQEESC